MIVSGDQTVVSPKTWRVALASPVHYNIKHLQQYEIAPQHHICEKYRTASQQTLRRQVHVSHIGMTLKHCIGARGRTVNGQQVSK